MSERRVYPTDPMAAFFAAVTAVENGSVGEIELEFRFNENDTYETAMSITIRRDARPSVLFGVAPTDQGDTNEKNEP